jgi:hypothetical protein
LTNFRLLGDWFILAVLETDRICPNFWNSISPVNNFDKNRLGHILSDFFLNSSGHFAYWILAFPWTVVYLWTFGIFPPFWNVAPRKIWQPCLRSLFQARGVWKRASRRSSSRCRFHESRFQPHINLPEYFFFKGVPMYRIHQK